MDEVIAIGSFGYAFAMFWMLSIGIARLNAILTKWFVRPSLGLKGITAFNHPLSPVPPHPNPLPRRGEGILPTPKPFWVGVLYAEASAFAGMTMTVLHCIRC